MKKSLLTFSLIALSAAAFAQTIPNAGFENWHTDTSNGTGAEDPDEWTTSNFGVPVPSVVNRSTDNHSGSYSVKVEQGDIFGNTFPGYLGISFPANQKPAFLNGYCKNTVSAGDTIALVAQFTGGGDAHGGGEFASVSHASWTAFSIALSYPSTFTPDTVNIYIFVEGAGAPEAYFDDLSFGNTAIGSPFGASIFTGLRKNALADLHATVYPNPATETAGFSFVLPAASPVHLSLTSILGNEVRSVSREMGAGRQQLSLDLDGLSNGIYFYTISSSTGLSTGKITVNNK